jgi:tetratricopeptide (TPR) repeat protein
MKPFPLPATLVFLFSVSLSTSLRSSNSQLLGGRRNPVRSARRKAQGPSQTLLFNQDGDGIITDSSKQRLTLAIKRQEWLDKSLDYYTKVMREERRRALGQAVDYDTAEYQDTLTSLAKKHYFALHKIKSGQWRHAETIYRRVIMVLVEGEDGECNHAQLAVTTLLLALLLQRMGLRKETRSVFLHFFRVAILDQQEDEECACSAKVLQAYALFEMKQGNSLKSLELVKRAVQLDPSLTPVLSWKQFRDVLERKSR